MHQLGRPTFSFCFCFLVAVTCDFSVAGGAGTRLESIEPLISPSRSLREELLIWQLTIRYKHNAYHVIFEHLTAIHRFTQTDSRLY